MKTGWNLACAVAAFGGIIGAIGQGVAAEPPPTTAATASSSVPGTDKAEPAAIKAPPLSLYGRLPGFEMAALSPSGDRVAIIGTVSEQRHLLVIELKDNKLILNQLIGDVKVRGLHWAGESRVLLRKSDTSNLGFGFTAAKAELQSMIVIPLGGGKVFQIFQGNDMVTGGIRGFYGTSEREGQYFGYFGGMTLDGTPGSSTYLKTSAPVLYEVNLESGRATKLASRTEGERDWRSWTVGSDGKVKATIDFQSDNGRWVIRNAASQRIVEGVNPRGGIDFVGLGATPDTLIYSAEDESEDRAERWYELPLAGGEAKEVLADKRIAQTFFDRRSRTMLGYEISGDMPSYSFSDARQQKVLNATLKAFPGRSVHLQDWNDAFDRLVVMTEGPEDPQNWWTIDMKTGQANNLGISYPMNATAVGPMRMITYKAGDGTEIAAVLTLPPGRTAKALPVVILPHGGPASRDYPGFDWWAQALASRGYAVLQPNFRGSTGYSVGFQRAGHGEWGRKMQTDLSDGLAWLAREGIVDPKRACIMGASYGGYAALAGVTLQKGVYRCAVSVAGVSDVAKMANTDISESGDNQTVKRAVRAEVGAHRDLRAVSPVNFAAQADAPVLLIHGKDDVVVLYDQSSDMASALRRAGKPVEFVTLPGEDHWLSRSKTRLSMLENAVAFVEKHNPPDPAP
ncbi:MAG TPA: S9 family peptidase [Sphingobium sp.]